MSEPALNLPALAALLLAACTGSLLLKKLNPAYAFALSLTAGALFGSAVLRAFAPLNAFLQRLSDAGPWPAAGLLLLCKGLAVGILCSMGCAVCADCGEHFLGEQVLFAGKIGLLLIGLPLLNAFFDTVEQLLSSVGAP